MADIVAAEMQREMGVSKGMREKEQRAWNHWVECTKCIGFENDVWLKSLTPDHRTTIIGAFADANFQDLIQLTWLQAQSRRPLQNWERFLGQTWGSTPHMSQVLRDYTLPFPDNSKE